MKCVCGYEGEDFKVLPSPLIDVKFGDWPIKKELPQQIYACPKCGTLKLEVKNG